MKDIDSQIQEVKTILSNYRQATTIRRSKRASNHNRYRACPIYQKLLDVGIDSFTAKQMDRQAHKYNIDPNLNVTQTLNALKDHKQVIPPSKGAFTYPTNKQRAIPGFQDNTTRSTDKSLTESVPDKKFTPSSMGNDYDSCVSSLSGPAPDGLGVDIETAKAACAKQWLGKGTVGGQSKNASVTNFELPSWVWATTMRPESIEQIERQVSQESFLRNASSNSNRITEVPVWAAVNMSPSELAQAQEELDRHKPTKFRSAADESKHAERMKLIHETWPETMRRRADNRMRQANVEEDKIDSDIPAWAVCAGYGLE